MFTENKYISVNLDTLKRITNLINSTLKLSVLLEIVMLSAKEALKSEASSLLLLDNDKQELSFYVVTGDKSEIVKDISIPIGKGIAGRVAQTGIPIIVNDAENDSRIFKAVDEKANQITKNLICVPMKVKGKIVGVLEVINSKESSSFTEEHISILSFIADQAAIAINNTDLFEQLSKTKTALESRVNELSLLYEYSNIANSVITIQELFMTTINFIEKKLKIESIFIYVSVPDREVYILSYFSRLKDMSYLNKSFSHREVQSFFKENPKPYIINDIDSSFINFKPQKGFSILSVPIYTEGNIFGFILLVADEKYFLYSSFHLRILENISSHLSQTYTNLKLQKFLLEQNHIGQELKIAYSIQQRILPDTFPVLNGIEIQGMSLPAEEVGGDFYDFIKIDDSKFVVLVADVSGKGIPASLFMALARNTIRTEAQLNPNPKIVMTKANELLVEDSESGMFVTAAYFLVDSFNKAITYVSAGHDSQLFYRTKDGEVERIKTMGRPLGVLPDTKFEEKVFFYEKGDLLFLFTDGIIEAEKFNGDQYEEWRLINFLKKNNKLALPDLLKLIQYEVAEFTENRPFTDDFTILAARL